MRSQQSARDVGDSRLAPIRLWVQANRGMVLKITAWLQERSGESITRQTVGRWLATDLDKRQMPSYGWGLLLEEAYKALASEPPPQKK